MASTQKRLIPAWLWAGVAVIALAAALALFTMDRRSPPGASFAFNVSDYARISPKDVLFRETQRIAVNVPHPRAMAAARDGSLFVGGENAVLALDAEGKEQARFAVEGTPECMAVSPDGKLLLAWRNHVEVWDARGTRLSVWPDLGERACLTSIAADDKHVFVADAGNRVVLRYDPDGKLLGRIGEADPARNIPGLNVPSPYLDVAFDAMGSLWVVNPGKHGLENYRPDGDLLSSWYRPGMDLAGFCGCCNPIHIAFLSDGSVVTAEKGLSRIKLYGPDTTLSGVVATPEGLQAPETQALAYDADPPVKEVAVDARGRVLVLHQPLCAIFVFEKTDDMAPK